ncbi:MAG TPA: DegT/DnrJ/EryC1/StrS family aminotransferase [Flavobacteriales bacterium]|nr:DegT/DnrJ/EryC1/StrS family aminotransferase [Flavobacteriales bacterium]HIA12310.1 DegT/DnrJ/EryC1/StrS family aminotransferase [Flavobacteriales bacterium]
MKRNILISQPVLGDEEWNAMKQPLETGWVTQGPLVKEFEDEFARKHEVKHALACTSATTALHLSLVALNIKQGDEVIVPSFTWIATANVVLYCGARPILVDIDTSTFNMDPNDVAAKITKKTKAIIAVHLFGLCADMDLIRECAGDIPIIEDAACAAGAKYKDKFAGGLGVLGCFSFHPRKSITTGEGGMVTTNDDALADKINMLRNHGASISEEQRHHGPRPYILADFNILGFNYRMTDLQGAVGTIQLKKLNQFIEERNKWASFYNEQFRDIEWINTPVVPDDCRHGWQSYVVMIDENKSPHTRNKIMELLQDKGISTRPGTHAVHMLNFYSDKYSISPDEFPSSVLANNCSIAIPLHNKMTEEDYEYVAAHIKDIT